MILKNPFPHQQLEVSLNMILKIVIKNK